MREFCHRIGWTNIRGTRGKSKNTRAACSSKNQNGPNSGRGSHALVQMWLWRPQTISETCSVCHCGLWLHLDVAGTKNWNRKHLNTSEIYSTGIAEIMSQVVETCVDRYTGLIIMKASRTLKLVRTRARLYFEGPRDFVNETHAMRFVTPKPVQRYLSLSPQMLLTRNILL